MNMIDAYFRQCILYDADTNVKIAVFGGSIDIEKIYKILKIELALSGSICYNKRVKSFEDYSRKFNRSDKVFTNYHACNVTERNNYEIY